MAPKGGNAKKESGRAKKAENEAKKQEAAAADKERKEADKWSDGAKSGKGSKEDKEERRKAELARKAENARLLAEEEASAPSKPKPTPAKSAGNKSKSSTAKAKKDVAAEKPAGPGAIAAGGGLGGDEGDGGADDGARQEVESYSATGIDNALDLLDVVTQRMDKASVGSKAAEIEKHPERRFKAAFEAYQERELPNLKQDRPGLRLQQYKDILFKQFQKSPENPFNQTTVSYDASKEEKVDALKRRQSEVEQRLKEKS